MDAGSGHRNQPPVRAPADHATGGCGRPNRGQVHDGESGRWAGGGGTLIRHAAADAIRALAVAVVEAPFEAALMPRSGGPHRAAAVEPSAPRRAVGLAAVTRRADGKQAAAVSAGLLAQRDVHGVGARGATSDWTTRANRGTTAPTGSLCRSSGRSRGSGGQTPGPHPTSESTAYATRTSRRSPHQLGGCGRRQRPQPSSSSASRPPRTRQRRKCADRRRELIGSSCWLTALPA